MNARLRFAIIGCGRIAPRHAAEIVKHGRLVAVCDIIESKAEELAAPYNARAYRNIDELLREENPEVVAICTPNGLHAMHSIQALRAGAHVLCEKPLCISVADGHEMNAEATKANRKLFVVKSTRYNPALVSLKSLLTAGLLGRLYSFQLNCFWNRPPAYYADSWRGTRDMDGGTLYTQFSHYIDAMLWLLGDVNRVTGFRANLAHAGSIEFEDSGIAALEMRNGMMGGINWSVNAFQKNMEVSLTMLAEKGSIRIAGDYMNSVDYQLTEKGELVRSDAGKANDYGFYKGSMSNHHQIYLNLLKALEDNQHPFASVEDGIKTVETIEMIYNSVTNL